jgi:hypothetical protein
MTPLDNNDDNEEEKVGIRIISQYNPSKLQLQHHTISKRLSATKIPGIKIPHTLIQTQNVTKDSTTIEKEGH